jgi:hypothetical protein
MDSDKLHQLVLRTLPADPIVSHESVARQPSDSLKM